MLYLVRHGQTAANAGGLIQGQSDFDLTEVGRAQADALAGALPTEAEIIASPLERALQTAGAIAARNRRSVTVDRRWIEMDFGELDGRPVSDARTLLWPNWEVDPDWAPAGGESLGSVHRRVTEACVELAPRFAAHDVIVVTHVSPIKSAVAWALRVSPLIAGRMFVEQAAVCTLVIGRQGEPLLRSFNELPTAPREPGTGGRAG